ncbi:MAG TPA: ATP-binding cassette domain-containing protein [Tepidisphaeraceae bacterium]|nr:ATP-binding cassette domain-containing protein [Tepidisphaeraceae bacterium]
MITRITIQGGRGRAGQPEPVRQVDLTMGQVISIVGPTGSGKTTLINDVALFADGSTPTGRRILIDGQAPPPVYRDDPAHNPVAIITQHTNFLSDLPVGEFLATHANIRHRESQSAASLANDTVAFANQLTGEPVNPKLRMTELSGGQTRALLIADAVVIGNAPVILLDEIENAGIHRTRALELLRQHRKIFVFVTHDPYIALLSDIRIVMGGGVMLKLMHATDEERSLSLKVRAMDDLIARLRNKIRIGEDLTPNELEMIA